MAHPPHSLRLELPRSTRSIPRARSAVTRLLRHCRLPIGGDVIADLEVAVSEAVTNAVRHGDGRHVAVDARVDGGEITVTVTDGGTSAPEVAEREMPPPHEVGGRGLPLMRALVDEVQMASGPSGTTVVMRRHLSTSSEESS